MLLLADTPDLLAYPVPLDDLYPMEIVTPGWFIGEAAYRAVADEVESGGCVLPPEGSPSWGGEPNATALQRAPAP